MVKLYIRIGHVHVDRYRAHLSQGYIDWWTWVVGILGGSMLCRFKCIVWPLLHFLVGTLYDSICTVGIWMKCLGTVSHVYRVLTVAWAKGEYECVQTPALFLLPYIRLLHDRRHFRLLESPLSLISLGLTPSYAAEREVASCIFLSPAFSLSLSFFAVLSLFASAIPHFRSSISTPLYFLLRLFLVLSHSHPSTLSRSAHFPFPFATLLSHQPCL